MIHELDQTGHLNGNRRICLESRAGRRARMDRSTSSRLSMMLGHTTTLKRSARRPRNRFSDSVLSICSHPNASIVPSSRMLNVITSMLEEVTCDRSSVTHGRDCFCMTGQCIVSVRSSVHNSTVNCGGRRTSAYELYSSGGVLHRDKRLSTHTFESGWIPVEL